MRVSFVDGSHYQTRFKRTSLLTEGLDAKALVQAQLDSEKLGFAGRDALTLRLKQPFFSGYSDTANELRLQRLLKDPETRLENLQNFLKQCEAFSNPQKIKLFFNLNNFLIALQERTIETTVNDSETSIQKQTTLREQELILNWLSPLDRGIQTWPPADLTLIKDQLKSQLKTIAASEGKQAEYIAWLPLLWACMPDQSNFASSNNAWFKEISEMLVGNLLQAIELDDQQGLQAIIKGLAKERKNSNGHRQTAYATLSLLLAHRSVEERVKILMALLDTNLQSDLNLSKPLDSTTVALFSSLSELDTSDRVAPFNQALIEKLSGDTGLSFLLRGHWYPERSLNASLKVLLIQKPEINFSLLNQLCLINLDQTHLNQAQPNKSGYSVPLKGVEVKKLLEQTLIQALKDSRQKPEAAKLNALLASYLDNPELTGSQVEQWLKVFFEVVEFEVVNQKQVTNSQDEVLLSDDALLKLIAKTNNQKTLGLIDAMLFSSSYRLPPLYELILLRKLGVSEQQDMSSLEKIVVEELSSETAKRDPIGLKGLLDTGFQFTKDYSQVR